jgi:protein-tyrosine phosphatase
MKILMVCLGNICRSPLADGLLRHKVQREGISATVDSAGTANYHVGGPPDERMTETAMNNGIDISYLRARQFEVPDFDNFDLIYVMDQSNYSNVTRLARNENDINKVKLILLELGESERISEVPDPYYGGQGGFDHVFDLLDRATDVIIEKLKNG